MSSSEEEITRKVVKKAAPRKLGPPQDKEDSSKGKVSSSKPAPKKLTAVKKKFVESSDEENPPPKKSKARQVVDSGDDSDFEVESIAAKPRTTGRYWSCFYVDELSIGKYLNYYGKCLFYSIFIASSRWEKKGGGQLWTRRFIRQRLLKGSKICRSFEFSCKLTYSTSSYILQVPFITSDNSQQILTFSCIILLCCFYFLLCSPKQYT